MDAQLLQTLAMILGPTGAAYAGVKVSLNGTKARVERIENKFDAYIDTTVKENNELLQRVATLEERARVAAEESSERRAYTRRSEDRS